MFLNNEQVILCKIFFLSFNKKTRFLLEFNFLFNSFLGVLVEMASTRSSVLAARSQRPNVLIDEGWETLGAAEVVGSQGVDPLRERFVKIFDNYFAGRGTAPYTVYASDVIEFIADLCQAAQEAVPATCTPPAPPIASTIANESMTPPRVFSIVAYQ